MEYNQQKLRAILEKPELTEEDRQWLLELLDEPELEEEVKKILQERFQAQSNAEFDVSGAGPLQLLDTIHHRLNLPPVRAKTHFLLRPAVWASAASVVSVVLFISFWFSRKTSAPPLAGKQTPVSQQVLVTPGTTGAILTLSDGSTIVLDSANNGALRSDKGTNIIKDGSSIIYKGKAGEEAVTFNTMTTPNGRQFQLMLADGSRVWLNAASSIRFPTAFKGAERSVEVSGEAYFEVKKDAAKPFRVKTGDTWVDVLGTNFNVNSYDATARITLLEGSVRVKSAIGSRQSAVLKPGQQAILTHDSGLTIDVAADTSAATAWKNGHFLFDDADLQSIMRLITRWYDVQVVYQGAIPERTFSADISQKTELKDFLKVLEEIGVRFKLEGKTLTVLN